MRTRHIRKIILGSSNRVKNNNIMINSKKHISRINTLLEFKNQKRVITI